MVAAGLQKGRTLARQVRNMSSSPNKENKKRKICLKIKVEAII